MGSAAIQRPASVAGCVAGPLLHAHKHDAAMNNNSLSQVDDLRSTRFAFGRVNLFDGEDHERRTVKRPVHLERSFHLDRFLVLRESRERAIPDRGSFIQHDVGVCIGDRRGRVQHETHSHDRKDQWLELLFHFL